MEKLTTSLDAQIPPSKHHPPHQASTDSQESFELLENEDSASAKLELSKSEPMEVNQTSPVASFKPHFYIPDEDGSPINSAPQTPNRAKQIREKKESVVVIISMQKENPVDRSSLQTLEAQDVPLSNGESASDCSIIPEPRTNHELDTGSSFSVSSKPLQLDLRSAASNEEPSEPKADVQKKFVSQSISISMKEKAANVAFPPKRSRLTFSKCVHVSTDI